MFPESIIKAKPNCIFVSPHFDDAIYSSCGLMSYLKQHNVPVSLVTVFTEAKSPSTLSGKAFLRECGYGSAEELYTARVQENEDVAKKMNIHVFNLGFTDALWRKKENLNIFEKKLSFTMPEFSHVYPTYKFHMKHGKISDSDKKLAIIIRNKIKKIIKDNQNTIIFVPLALGKHVDHVITRNAVKNLGARIIYWEDFPYNIKFHDQEKFIEIYKLKKFTFTDFDPKVKETYIRMYRSQTKAMFHGLKIDILPEGYYYKKNE